MPDDPRYRLFAEERDLVFYIGEHEALRLGADGRIYVWGEYALSSPDVVQTLRSRFIHGASDEAEEPTNPGLKIRGDN
jgi:hypothetical protein